MSDREKALPQSEIPIEAPDEKGKTAKKDVGRFRCALRQTPPRVLAAGVTSGRVFVHEVC